MGTTLQYLHQNLYQLKHSRLMENEVFKELYYEAKGHEKHANLNNLTSRSKNDKLYQETNFYLILTKMLNELKEIDPSSHVFKNNLEKVYKWYSKNKQAFAKTEKNKVPIAMKDSDFHTFRSGFTEDKIDRNQSRQTNKSTRELSPVYFPSLKNAIKLEDISSSFIVKNNENKISKSKVTDENFSNDRSNINKSRMSGHSENTDKNSKINKDDLVKNTFDEKSRSEILKALSVYADQIYTSIDKTDTKKLENNLKSLSKFYNALTNYTSLNVPKEPKSSITLSSLIDVAKEVSDRMIISKNQLNNRISENRQLWESLKNTRKEASELKAEASFNEIQETNENKENKEITKFINTPVYSIITRDISKRPKSTAFTDWRGCISRPTTAKKSKSALKFNLTSSISRPKSSISIAQIEVGEPKEQKFENEKTDEDLSEKLKRQRSFTKLKSQTRESTSSFSEGKEVKFVSFIAKIRENADQKAEINDQKETLTEKSEEKTPSNLTVSETINEKSTEKITDNVTDNFTENGTYKTSQTEKLRCLHNEINECECCKVPRTPSPSFVHHPKNDIFHLTYANDDLKNPVEMRKNLVSLATETSNEPEQNISLREILLTNYDPQYAAKIGINNFLPIEVMTAQNNGKDLEFIPFENIDSSYPRVQGFPIFDPNYNKPQRKLYRTNPSIPRPESKYGTRSSVYEQILDLKRKNLDTTALVVWQPEDVNLVKDLLDIEQAPLKETLKVESLKPDIRSENYELVEYNKNQDSKKPINTQITPMGRPVNVNNKPRWKKEENSNEKTNENKINSDSSKEEKYESTSQVNFSARTRQTTGNSIRRFEEFLYEGRPLPTARTIQDPDKEHEAYMRYSEIKQSVHIPSLFKGTTIGRNYVKEFNPAEIEKRENERRAAIKIQRQYRKHLHDKRLIANRSADPDTLAWAINHRNELQKRKMEREAKILEENRRIEKENARLKTLLKKIGVHVDIYQALNQKGPEYTTKVLNKAASCIQKWVRGWLVRKEIKKLKGLLSNDNVDWYNFTSQYRKTILRILKMRGSFIMDCEFIPHEAMEFYLKEKKFTSYFNKLAFSNEIDLMDIVKMFNFVDLYPSNEEIQEAKLNVLKFYKKKANSTSISKRAMFDIIYYIYPPLATKLKSTRKSTWMNPIVDGEDALRLKGFKIVEPTVMEKSWKLVREHSIAERLNSIIPSAINKNTPVQEFEDDDQ
ncbi:unnamed protein product [Brachionus calyciflorus]|uniref:Uncharacterized protein n=1 Tax=Brachionus calyciflorus TaxID=104777 RepID=A0A813LZE9_9BILA|nr:unnamed protein product [Brachionus calyciflorus]